jgi:hypothetical protein
MAWRLFIRGATPAEIAATPDPNNPGHTLYRTESGARVAVQRARSYLGPMEGVEELRQQALAMLLSDLVEANRIMATRHPLLDRTGRPVMIPAVDRNGNPRQDGQGNPVMIPAEDDDVRLRAMREKRHITARIAALMGLDAAQKFEVGAPGGGPLELEVRVAALNKRFDNITLLPLPPVIDADSEDVDDAEEA